MSNNDSTANVDYPVNIKAPDISPFREGNTGIDYFHTFAADADGPHVCITALVHGNEYCGAIALRWLLAKQPVPKRGQLTLGFVNVAAFESFDAAQPTASRFVDEDFNRLWAEDVLNGDRDSVELRRAREIRPVIDSVDVLLDVHSMQQPSPPLMMCGPEAKGRALGKRVASTDFCITDSGHTAGKRMRDYHRFIDGDAGRNALLVECGQHWETSSVDIAKKTVARFLTHVNVVDAQLFDDDGDVLESIEPKLVEVSGPYTIQNPSFRFAHDYQGMEVVPNDGTVIGYDGDDPVTTPYDNCVLVMPSRRLYAGQTAVRFGRVIAGD